MRLSALLSLFILLVAFEACGGQTTDGLSFAVEERGPFEVGYRTFQVTYDEPGVDTPRTIQVAVWYPTNDDGEGASFPRYFPPLFADRETIVDASLAEPVYRHGYPVLVHSHGHQGFPGNSYHLMKAFARHGWVVVAPAHAGDIFLDAQATLRTWFERPLDVTAALDALEALPPTDPLAGRMALDRVVLSGHSRGALTVWAILGATFDTDYVAERCASGQFDAEGGCPAAQVAVFEQSFRDARVVAGITMASDGGRAWFSDGAAMNAVTAPVLLLTGGDDPVGAPALFADLDAVALTWVEIAGGCHQLFGYGLCSQIDDAIGLPIVDTYALAFARAHLFADTDATVLGILDGSFHVSDLVSFEAR